MEYCQYTFRKDIASVRKGYLAETQQHLQPLERICQEAGGIILDGWVDTPGSDDISGPDIFRRTDIFLVDNAVVKNIVYLSHPDRREQSSVQTEIIYRHQGVDLPPFFDKIKEYYGTEPAFRYEDSDKRLAGEKFVPQGMERKNDPI